MRLKFELKNNDGTTAHIININCEVWDKDNISYLKGLAMEKLLAKKVTNLYNLDLSEANLDHLNFGGCYLHNTNLKGASLWNTIGNGREIISLQLNKWKVVYTAEHLQIGCEGHAITKWWRFEADKIRTMSNGAVRWWKVHKPLLKAIIKANPANTTGHERKGKK